MIAPAETKHSAALMIKAWLKPIHSDSEPIIRLPKGVKPKKVSV